MPIRFLFYFIFIFFSINCTNVSKKENKLEEDVEAKKTLQGTWINELEGDEMFTVKGDTLYYADSISAPVAFCVRHDSLIIFSHSQVSYVIKRLNTTQLHFENSNGDVIELVKSNNTTQPLERGEYKGAIDINQGKKIKRDSILKYREKNYHAYSQVNPTTYKVYQQKTNDDGLTVETIFYDNLVYIALYDGVNKVFGQNIVKTDFSNIVPEEYLKQAILSDIIIDGVVNDMVRFIAILSIPDSYTNYRVNIDVSFDGKKRLSI